MKEQSQKSILVIKGSSRENGYTNRLFEDVKQSLKGVRITVFDPYKIPFEYCRGCDICKETQTCIYSDLDDFFKVFENADVIIFLSPVYNGGFSAPVKALIDRFQVYYNKFYKYNKIQPISKKRKIILACASGRKAYDEFTYMEKLIKRAFTVLNGEYIGGICCYDTDSSPDYDGALNEFKLILKRSLTDE